MFLCTSRRVVEEVLTGTRQRDDATLRKIKTPAHRFRLPAEVRRQAREVIQCIAGQQHRRRELHRQLLGRAVRGVRGGRNPVQSRDKIAQRGLVQRTNLHLELLGALAQQRKRFLAARRKSQPLLLHRRNQLLRSLKRGPQLVEIDFALPLVGRQHRRQSVERLDFLHAR